MVYQHDIPAIYGHVAVRFLNCIFVFGGQYVDDVTRLLSLRTIWMYNLYTELWKKHVIPNRNLAPSPSYDSCAVAVGSDIYMFGGCVYEKYHINRNFLWKLTIRTTGCFVWSQIMVKNRKKAPSPRKDHSGWEYAGKVWMFGGSGSSPEGYLNVHGDFQSYIIINFFVLILLDKSGQTQKHLEEYLSLGQNMQQLLLMVKSGYMEEWYLMNLHRMTFINSTWFPWCGQKFKQVR